MWPPVVTVACQRSSSSFRRGSRRSLPHYSKTVLKVLCSFLRGPVNPNPNLQSSSRHNEMPEFVSISMESLPRKSPRHLHRERILSPRPRSTRPTKVVTNSHKSRQTHLSRPYRAGESDHRGISPEARDYRQRNRNVNRAGQSE